jgi:hypothetical protein
MAALFAASGLSNSERMTDGQRMARDDYRMAFSPVKITHLPIGSTGKPKKKPFGATKLNRAQRKHQTVRG